MTEGWKGTEPTILSGVMTWGCSEYQYEFKTLFEALPFGQDRGSFSYQTVRHSYYIIYRHFCLFSFMFVTILHMCVFFHSLRMVAYGSLGLPWSLGEDVWPYVRSSSAQGVLLFCLCLASVSHKERGPSGLLARWIRVSFFFCPGDLHLEVQVFFFLRRSFIFRRGRGHWCALCNFLCVHLHVLVHMVFSFCSNSLPK